MKGPSYGSTLLPHWSPEQTLKILAANDCEEPKPTYFCDETNVSYAQQDLPSCIGGHGTVA